MSKLFTLLLAGTIGVLLCTQQSTFAAIPDQAGVFHACMNRAGKIRLIDAASTNCRSSETALSWNQKGPAGNAPLYALVYDVSGVPTVAGTGAVSVARYFTGLYVVSYDRDVSNCKPVAGPIGNPNNSAPAPGGDVSTNATSTNTASVVTSRNGVPASDVAFYIALFCN